MNNVFWLDKIKCIEDLDPNPSDKADTESFEIALFEKIVEVDAQ